MSEAPLMGALALLLAGVMIWRGVNALRTGEVALYRRRADRAELGGARYWFAVGMQFVLALVLLLVAADVFLGLGLRPR